ncbi:hypothetical protein [Allobranchiibius sp. CTAmp26]|uniref:hypothetical protein n=1 Tax=Allobranchiibius sp. CTAmp26 TaxID=2815214 RepID=UPI001AA1C26B|nr:hypothetical protein [Allobranchiibius sp. CTAmp26]MBO1756867.1 hypothetical protein [Allobranchiibius sp. CTAmp26]
MNEYGVTAQKHWRTFLPSQYAQLSDPSRFFSDLGTQATAQETAIVAQLQAQHRGELNSLDYLARVGRINAMRGQAREMVLAELLPTPVENQTDLAVPDPLAELMDRDGMPTDHSHPLWAMGEDRDVTAAQWEAARAQWESGLRQQISSR